jgi:hypothetical protein
MFDYNDESGLYELEDVTVVDGQTAYVPAYEQFGVLDLTVESNATLVVDGNIAVFGDILGGGTITGEGEVADRPAP